MSTRDTGEVRPARRSRRVDGTSAPTYLTTQHKHRELAGGVEGIDNGAAQLTSASGYSDDRHVEC